MFDVQPFWHVEVKVSFSPGELTRLSWRSPYCKSLSVTPNQNDNEANFALLMDRVILAHEAFALSAYGHQLPMC